MRPTWTGALSIGLLTVPVKLYPATREHDTRFHLYHRNCGEPVRFQKVCPKHEQALSAQDIVKGVDRTGAGGDLSQQIITFEDAELSNLPLPGAGAIHIAQFVPRHGEDGVPTIGAVRKAKAHYLGIGKGGDLAYSLLYRGMESRDLLGIGKVAMRGNEQLVAIEPVGDNVLACWYLFWADEVTQPADLHQDLAAVKDADLALAVAMLDGFTDGPGLDALADESEAALQAAISTKLAGGALQPVPALATTNIGNVMDTIRRNMELAAARKAS